MRRRRFEVTEMYALIEISNQRIEDSASITPAVVLALISVAVSGAGVTSDSDPGLPLREVGAHSNHARPARSRAGDAVKVGCRKRGGGLYSSAALFAGVTSASPRRFEPLLPP